MRNSAPDHGTFPDTPSASIDGSPAATVRRRGDAWERLREMDAVEEDVRWRERITAEIADRLQRLTAEYELDVEYLLRFGVTAAERGALRDVLVAVERDGGLTLREAADLAHARQRAARPRDATPVAMSGGAV